MKASGLIEMTAVRMIYYLSASCWVYKMDQMTVRMKDYL